MSSFLLPKFDCGLDMLSLRFYSNNVVGIVGGFVSITVRRNEILPARSEGSNV